MRDVIYKTLEEILRSVAEDGEEVTEILKLAKAGEESRVLDALAHLERAKELYEQAAAEAKSARINLTKAKFDIEILYKFPEPPPDEMLLRVIAARAALLGKDGPGMRRRVALEKAEGTERETDSSLRSE